jgi:hypothetical protein
MENTPAQSLYDLLVTRDFEPETLSSSGKPVTDPTEAELFSFDWKTQGQDYGTVVVLLGADNELEVYYGDNLGRGMDPEHKSDWYDFLAQLKNFATRNLLTFELNNINRLKYTMQGMAAIREGLFEGYYGRRRVSYSDQPERTRLMIRHDRDLQEGEPRYRAIESLFVETAAGERFRVPSRNLMHGRMLARHIAEGGTPYDAFGQHINTVMEELMTLSRFVRASRGRDLSEDAQALTQEAQRHYHDLRAKARRMISRRGYHEALDEFDPTKIDDSEAMTQHIREMFIDQRVDERIEAALPILARLGERSMREADEFESWAHTITEGTWSLPETPEQIEALRQMLLDPMPVGADAVNATQQLYDILGDDQLFDRLEDLARENADADARATIIARLAELGIDLDISVAGTDTGSKQPDMSEDLDTDGVMMTRPSNMSSESLDRELSRLRALI